MSTDRRYEMTISLNVLKHLGISLYNSIPPVLSEIVANSWDADASEVKICIHKDDDIISISDNGHGMNEADINGKYLKVGYDKRNNEPPLTKKFERPPMGRKGIGKLSVFAIAHVVEVYTTREGEKHALVLDANEIEKAVSSEETGGFYTPAEGDTGKIDFDEGTRIVLKGLKKNITATTIKGLRQRLSRRFSIIGESNNFSVSVNGAAITSQDRGYYKNVQFLWYFGDESKSYATLVGEKVTSARLDNNLQFSLPDGTVSKHKITGWLGTVELPRQLNDETNGIVVYAKGKLIEENLLPEMDDARLFTEYLVGEIDADFMDLDELDDIITSNRQSVKKDDPRYDALHKIAKESLKIIGNKWTDLRNEKSTAEAKKDKNIADWYDSLTVGQQKYAKKMFGRIETMGLPDNKARREVYKANIFAFERLSLTHQLDLLDRIHTDQDMNTLLELFGTVDELEAYHYFEIVKGRLNVIEKFQKLVGENAKERVLQDYLFDHLWLLDSSWERAAVNPLKETTVPSECKEIEGILTDEESAGRIDISYQTLGGKHVIIELKRSEPRVQLMDLVRQVTKYYNALDKCLNAKFPNSYPNMSIEVICILGKPPGGGRDAKHVADVLATSNARYVTYDELIAQAKLSYKKYLNAQSRVGKLAESLDKIYAEFPS